MYRKRSLGAPTTTVSATRTRPYRLGGAGLLMLVVIASQVFSVSDKKTDGLSLSQIKEQSQNIDESEKNNEDIDKNIDTDIAQKNEEGVAEIEEPTLDTPIIEDQLPESINLALPFFSQAPDGDWTLPWKEACEEASLALAAAYLQESKLTKEQFKTDIQGMVALQSSIFNNYIDTTMAETQEVFDQYYGIGTSTLIENPTIQQLKAALAAGNPIIAPFAGKLLGNKFYSGGGPRYHVLVIKGYDEKNFYTHDVGTKRGENFPYTHETIMTALHDLVRVGEGEITTGEKRVLVLGN